ncbi:hypothetical protein ILUMI_04871 [Ignelater luminosus]|uniref:Uncharacterized protein n=1 Tax=Ignelater luminosus TaxID=2038154 RepID=A0A8K0DIU9_IGNLU|nr:hypothetical protein ILUMI_04871 [Ignelater luminosus]
MVPDQKTNQGEITITNLAINKATNFYLNGWKQDNKNKTNFTWTNRKNKCLKIDNWNIRGTKDKEIELEKEFVGANLDVLIITETQRKSQGTVDLEGGNRMWYSGVEMEIHALLSNMYNQKRFGKRSKRLGRYIRQSDVHNSGETYTFITAYGPDKNDSKEIMEGDFKGRVGVKNEESIDVLGKNSETQILPTKQLGRGKYIFFQHNQIHQITRWERSREESSIIDYVLEEARELKTVKDIRVKRSIQISRNHLLLTVTINKERKIKTKAGKEKFRSVIDIQKLKSKNYKRQYQERIREEIKAKKHELESENIEQLWQLFKKIFLKATEEVCGREVLSNTRKQTP